MTQPHTFSVEPHIHTIGTDQLRRHVHQLARRHPEIEASIIAIRAGDNRPLLKLVRRSQSDDGDAATIAILAVLPRLCAVVINRLPLSHWKEAIDDYLALAYLVIHDSPPDETADYLADKIIARTRRRHERFASPRHPARLTGSWYLVEHEVDPDDVEEQALARVELSALGKALHDGLITPSSWHTVTMTLLHRPPDTAATPRERKAVSRARQRLDDWRNQTQAEAA